MPDDLLELLQVPVTPNVTETQGELCPPTEFSSILPAWKRDSGSESLKLETTGVSEHSRQLELLDKRLIQHGSIVAKLRAIGADDIAGPMLDCHTQQSYAQCNGCRKVRTFWNHCDRFYCPICQPRLARERAESIAWWAQQITQPKHLVLTARNSNRITFARVAAFIAIIRRLRRQKHANNWRSGAWSIEVTNEGRGWHLHAHLLIDADWINMTAVCKAWSKLVGQDYVIAKVKDVRGTEYVAECAKYAVKGSELAKWTGDEIAEFVNAFTGHHLFGVFGALHGLRKQLRDFLDSLIEERSRCECGCNQFKVYSDEEWNWKQATDSPIFSSRPNAPPLEAELPLR